MDWKPIFTDKEREIAERKVHEIARILSLKESHSSSLMYGGMGSCLFLFHYSFWSGDDSYYKRATRQLLSSLGKIQRPLLLTNNPLACLSALADGLSGIGWGIHHLLVQEMMDSETFDVMGTADPYIYRRMICDTRRDKLDLLQGATGTALYCLNGKERFALEYLKRFVGELYKQMPQNKLERIRDFSIPTGLAGLFLLLRKIRMIHPDMEYLPETMARIVSVLKDQSPGIPPNPRCSPGWNQNEVGILWCQLHIPETRNRAMEQWAQYGNLHTETNQAAFEAGLYGGNFSMGHLSNRIYQMSGESGFRDLAIGFFKKGLEHATYVERQTQSQVWLTGINGVYGLHPGLLGGLAGIGLALLAACSDRAPCWDEVLLLS